MDWSIEIGRVGAPEVIDESRHEFLFQGVGLVTLWELGLVHVRNL